MPDDRFQFRLRTFFVVTTILCVTSAISIRLSIFLMAYLVAVLGAIVLEAFESTGSKAAAYVGLFVFSLAMLLHLVVLIFAMSGI